MSRRTRPALLTSLFLAGSMGLGCSEDETLGFEFPAEFRWGSAVAGFQVDPGCPTLGEDACVDPNSDWYQWVTDPAIPETSTYLSGDPLSAGPGMWETYAEDYASAAGLGHTMHRMSIEWSRLFPDGAAESATTIDELAAYVDEEARDHYHAMFAAARAEGLDLMVTLNHYTLPTWIHDASDCGTDYEGCTNQGWRQPERIIPAIALYSGYCAREFGGEVDLWATLNEPSAVILAGYIFPGEARTNPPGAKFKLTDGIGVYYSMAEAHIAMYAAIHEADDVDVDGDGKTAMVGPVPNLAAVRPLDPDDPDDQVGAAHADYFYNRAFLNAVVHGEFDRDFDGEAEDIHPDWAGSVDFIGINYYTQLIVDGQGAPITPLFPWFDFLPDISELFLNYPDGIYEVLIAASAYGLPMYIAENGTPELDDGTADRFLRPHLEALHRAIEEGVDVRGYLAWSLVDNYEWNHGMQLRFGLYELEEDKSRTLRPHGEFFRDVALRNGF